MARVAERSALGPGEYLAWERRQNARHEYFRGEVFAMAGGSMRHNALCSNLNAALHAELRSKGCVVLTSDQPTNDGDVRIYTSARAGERVELSNGAVLDIDAIFAGVMDLPGD